MVLGGSRCETLLSHNHIGAELGGPLPIQSGACRTEYAEARLAVSLDDRDATAHAVLATMMRVVGDWEDSVGEARKALALNPNSAFVVSMLGLVPGRAGYHEEAVLYASPVFRGRAGFWDGGAKRGMCWRVRGERRRVRPSWARPGDWSIKTEGIRLAAEGPAGLNQSTTVTYNR